MGAAPPERAAPTFFLSPVTTGDAMNTNLLFVIVVVISFALWMTAAYGVPWAERAARTGFFIAALLWALGSLGKG